MISFYQMDHKEVNPGHAQVSRHASEGLRILARMIARQLVAGKFGGNEQCPSGYGRPCMPDTLVEEEAGNGSNKGTNG